MIFNMDINKRKEAKKAELEQMLCSNFGLDIKIKLHYSYRRNNDFVFGIYEIDKKYWLWKSSDAYLGEISTPDISLPFNNGEWEELKIVVAAKSSFDNFIKFAKEYEKKTAKTITIIKQF